MVSLLGIVLKIMGGKIMKKIIYMGLIAGSFIMNSMGVHSQGTEIEYIDTRFKQLERYERYSDKLNALDEIELKLSE